MERGDYFYGWIKKKKKVTCKNLDKKWWNPGIAISWECRRWRSKIGHKMKTCNIYNVAYIKNLYERVLSIIFPIYLFRVVWCCVNISAFQRQQEVYGWIQYTVGIHWQPPPYPNESVGLRLAKAKSVEPIILQECQQIKMNCYAMLTCSVNYIVGLHAVWTIVVISLSKPSVNYYHHICFGGGEKWLQIQNKRKTYSESESNFETLCYVFMFTSIKTTINGSLTCELL